ncbi:hypothetical protein DPMN_074569 [Dreissena polymorpha]|uniref:Uncharacterized protein n=1 Tax=Dreissena polymorpha TaxID=45954 RepID=A0A9D3YJI9_DREPO|nr:hypothetical protein DPMN_074569 [Dreissena polymorpha]
MQACEGFSLSIANNFEARHLQGAVPLFFSFVGNRIWSADSLDHSEAGVDEDLDFLHGDDGGSPGLFSIEKYLLRVDLRCLILAVMLIAPDPRNVILCERTLVLYRRRL